jgi:hypothetical protein
VTPRQARQAAGSRAAEQPAPRPLPPPAPGRRRCLRASTCCRRALPTRCRRWRASSPTWCSS